MTIHRLARRHDAEVQAPAEPPRRAIRRSLAVVAALAVLAAALVVGLLLSSGGAGTRAAPRPLTDWTVKGNEDPGYAPAGTKTYATAQKFYGGVPAKQADIALLRRNGYRSAVDEKLRSTTVSGGGTAGYVNAGLSQVAELGSPAAARRLGGLDMSAVASRSSGAVIKRFSVAGVPSAQGATVSFGHESGGVAEATFVEGSCVLLISDTASRGDLAAPVQHAVAAVYDRTHGACP